MKLSSLLIGLFLIFVSSATTYLVISNTKNSAFLPSTTLSLSPIVITPKYETGWKKFSQFYTKNAEFIQSSSIGLVLRGTLKNKKGDTWTITTANKELQIILTPKDKKIIFVEPNVSGTSFTPLLEKDIQIGDLIEATISLDPFTGNETTDFFTRIKK